MRVARVEIPAFTSRWDTPTDTLRALTRGRTPPESNKCHSGIAGCHVGLLCSSLQNDITARCHVLLCGKPQINRQASAVAQSALQDAEPRQSLPLTSILSGEVTSTIYFVYSGRCRSTVHPWQPCGRSLPRQSSQQACPYRSATVTPRDRHQRRNTTRWWRYSLVTSSLSSLVPQVLRLRLQPLWLRCHLLLRVLVRAQMRVAIDPCCVPRPLCCLVALACGYHLVDTRFRSLHLVVPHGRQKGADGITAPAPIT